MEKDEYDEDIDVDDALEEDGDYSLDGEADVDLDEKTGELLDAEPVEKEEEKGRIGRFLDYFRP